MNDLMQYFARVFGAMLLIRAAASLVKDAEKLITANVKARLPEVADELDGEVVVTEFEVPNVGVGAHNGVEWSDPLDTPTEEEVTRATED